MTSERFPRPPPPSLPKEAPWREIEAIIDGLNLVASKLDEVIVALGGIPAPPPTVVIPPGVAPPPPGITLDGRLDSLVKFTRVPLHWGQATGGSSTKLVHLGMNWEDDMFLGYEVAIIEGEGAGQIRAIKSNDRNSLTPREDWSVSPDNTSVYVIRQPSQFRNAASFTTGQKNVATAGTAEQFPDVAIPDGFRAIILAKPGNTGYIYYGNSKANAESTTARFDRLGPGDSIAVQVTNLNLFWIDASVDGEGISYYVEQ